MLSQDQSGLRAVVDPTHAWKLIAQELGGPILQLQKMALKLAPKTSRGYSGGKRGWEVRQCRSAREAFEQKCTYGFTGGECGGKDIGQGQFAPAKQIPDPELGMSVTGAGADTAISQVSIDSTLPLHESRLPIVGAAADGP